MEFLFIYKFFFPLIEINLRYNFKTNSGEPFNYFTYGVASSVVEIDCLTGDHQVFSAFYKYLYPWWDLHCGYVINPPIEIVCRKSANVIIVDFWLKFSLWLYVNKSLSAKSPLTRHIYMDAVFIWGWRKLNLCMSLLPVLKLIFSLQLEVLKSDIVMDLGESLNPTIDIGQIEGAFMQGFIWAIPFPCWELPQYF